MQYVSGNIFIREMGFEKAGSVIEGHGQQLGADQGRREHFVLPGAGHGEDDQLGGYGEFSGGDADVHDSVSQS